MAVKSQTRRLRPAYTRYGAPTGQSGFSIERPPYLRASASETS